MSEQQELKPDQKAAKGAIARLPKEQGGEGLKREAAYERYGGNKGDFNNACKLSDTAPDLLQRVLDDGMALKDAVQESKTNARLEAMERHPYSKAYRDIQSEEMEGLKASIARDGLHDPVIWVYPHKDGFAILDGHHRRTAAFIVGRGADLKVKLFKGSDNEAWLFTITRNVHRRNLPHGTKVALAWHSTKASEKCLNLGISPMTQEDAAKRFGVSRTNVQQFGELWGESQNDAEAVERGDKTMNAAYRKHFPANPKPKPASKPKGGDKQQGSKKPLVGAPTEDALKEAAEKGRREGVAAAQRALNAEKDRANQAEGDALKKAAAIDSLQKRLEEAEKARAHSSENGAGLDDDAEDLQTLRNKLEGARSEADAERKRRERAEVLNKEKDERIANLKASLSSFDSPEQDALSEDDEALPPKDAYEKALKQDKEQIKKWDGLPLEEAYGKAIGWIKQIRGSQWSEGCRYDLALRDLAIIEGEDVDAIRARYDNVNCNKYPDELRRREAKLKQREANGERPPA